MSAQSWSSEQEVERLFALQHAPENLQRLKDSPARDRIERIRRIERYLLDPAHMRAWTDALNADLGRSPEESKVIELLPLLAACREVYSNLRDWMSDEAGSAPLAMAGIRAWTHYEPKGHVLAIAPWNYPLQLALVPVIYAIAAGNAVLLKPSELSSRTSAFLREMIAELFDERDVAVVEGDASTATALLARPFHHIFFTGSPAVGRVVMRAAATHLASVTLELGGKSPVVVDRSYSITSAARKVAWGKCMNAGQTCIAPDYVLVPAERMDAFVEAYRQALRGLYDQDGKGIRSSPDYGRMINARNHARVQALIDDAVAQGARLAIAGDSVPEERYMAPQLLVGVTPQMAIMREEIFGPVLPVMAYEDIEEAPALINSLDRPLTMYILSHHRGRTRYLVNTTTAGTTAINELMVTSANPRVPFGGVNGSGTGKSNGRHGFIAFSNERAMQRRVWGSLAPLRPPFKPFFVRLAMRLARW